MFWLLFKFVLQQQNFGSFWWTRLLGGLLGCSVQYCKSITGYSCPPFKCRPSIHISGCTKAFISKVKSRTQKVYSHMALKGKYPHCTTYPVVLTSVISFCQMQNSRMWGLHQIEDTLISQLCCHFRHWHFVFRVWDRFNVVNTWSNQKRFMEAPLPSSWRYTCSGTRGISAVTDWSTYR